MVADEQRGEGDAAALATGEVVDEGVPRDVADEAADDVAHLGVAGPDVLVDAADDGVADGAGRRRGCRPGRACRCVTPRRRVTRPASGSMRPASSASSVDLPSPLRPTMPMRSPSLRPAVTLSKMTRVGNSRCRHSAPSKCAISPSAYRPRHVQPASGRPTPPLRRDCKFGRYARLISARTLQSRRGRMSGANLRRERRVHADAHEHGRASRAGDGGCRRSRCRSRSTRDLRSRSRRAMSLRCCVLSMCRSLWYSIATLYSG